MLSFRGFFDLLYFCMVKYLSFHNSSFALRYFLMWMARPQCDTPLVISDNSSPNKFMTRMQSKVPDMYFLNISDTNVENDLIRNRSWLPEKRPIWCSWQVKKKRAPTMKLQKLWPKWWSISAKRWSLQLQNWGNIAKSKKRSPYILFPFFSIQEYLMTQIYVPTYSKYCSTFTFSRILQSREKLWKWCEIHSSRDINRVFLD